MKYYVLGQSYADPAKVMLMCEATFHTLDEALRYAKTIPPIWKAFVVCEADVKEESNGR